MGTPHKEVFYVSYGVTPKGVAPFLFAMQQGGIPPDFSVWPPS